MTAGHPSKARLYFLLSLMLLFWSLNFTIGKVALREFPSLLLVGIRTTFAAILVLLIYFSQPIRKREKWPASDFWLLLALGLFGIILNQLLFVVGLAHTSVAHAAIVVTLVPIMVLLFAALIGQERITLRKAVGMIIAASGVSLIQFSKDRASGATLLGDFLLFLSVLAFAIYTVKSKAVTTRHTVWMPITIAYVGGTLALAPVTIWMGWNFEFAKVSAAAWGGLIYMALFSAVIAYLIYYFALTYLPASRVSAVSYLQPVVATSFGVLVLGERISTLLVFGGILVLTGVFVTERA